MLFDNPIIIFIGEISYGIYLWHWLIQVSVFRGSLAHYFDGVQLLLIGGIISFLITIAVASLSYFFLERPAIAIARRCQTFSELWQQLSTKFQY